MNILLIDNCFYPYLFGGGQKQAWELGKILAKKHNVHVLTARIYKDSPAYEEVENVRIHRVDTIVPRTLQILHYPLFFLLGAIQGLKIIKRERIDVIDGRLFAGVILGYIVSRLSGKPYVSLIHDFYLKQTWKNVIRDNGILGLLAVIYQWICISLPYDRIITVSEAMKQKYHREWGIPLKKIDVIHNGVNVNEFDKVSVERDPKKIIFLARMVDSKNPVDCVDAFKRVLDKHDDAELVMIGKGPLENEVKTLVKDITQIRFLGPVDSYDDVIKELKSSAALALPSDIEGFGLVLIEANACRVPYVAYDIPAVNEVTGITQGGILVKPHDIKELGEKMQWMLENPRRAEEMGLNGRKNVKENLTWERVAKRLEESYDNLLKQE